MKNKKQFTLIELIIVIIVIGILAAMAMPKFNGVVRNAKLSAMINDKEVLEKALVMYYQKNDELPLLNENEQLIVQSEGISLTKIVLAEEVETSDMDTIYKSLKETLTYYNDSEDSLYRIDLPKIKDNLSKDIKYGHKKHDKDFYVYSLKTGNVYYYDYLVNGNGTIQHTEYDTLLKENELVTKTISPSLNDEETIINNKPIIELTTNLDDITTDSIINWEYSFIDEDTLPTKISFILNNVEYDSFDKIPTQLDSGDYTIKFKIQDSKGLWSDEVIETFIVNINISMKNHTFATGYDFFAKIGKDGKLYTWGRNNYGQLGIGNTINQSSPQCVDLPNKAKPISLDIFENNLFVLANDGYVYSCGYNYNGELGIGTKGFYTNQSTLKRVSNIKNIKSISTGRFHTIAIGEDNKLYGWGANCSGELGNGYSGVTEIRTVPYQVQFPKINPKIIETGSEFTIMIADDGNLYSWGLNSIGQLGLGNRTNQSKPQLVNLPNNIKAIDLSVNYNNFLILCNDGNVYTNDIYGEINVVAFFKDKKVKKIFAGWYSYFVITDDNKLYAWGSNNNNKLGTEEGVNTNTPQLVKLPKNTIVKEVYPGESHTAFLTSENEIMLCGKAYDRTELYPTKIDLP